MQSAPRTVAVDLTPVLPGGDNGGAKVFVLELLRRLPAMHPGTRFIVLTQAAAHEELAWLDRGNVERLCVIGDAGAPARRSRLRELATRLLRMLPNRVRRRATGIALRVQAGLKRTSARGLLAARSVDLLYCPFTAPTFAESGIPVVSTIHDLQYLSYPAFFAPEDLAHRDAVFRATCREATLITAVSGYSRDSAIRAGALPSERVRVIHTRLASRLGAPAVRSAGSLAARLAAAGRYFLYPANFWKHKNHEMLLVAFGMAMRNGLPADVRLVCTGSPGERGEFLAESAAAMGLGERVLFPGFVADEELEPLLRSAHGVVFPSLYEGFGMPVLEAMAAGVPVACSDLTSLPEVAGAAALLFDPRDPEAIAAALLRLATDTALRNSLVDAGRERAVEFSDADRMAREYWDAFCDAMGRPAVASSLDGLFPDGWSPRELDVFLASDEAGATVDMELVLPPSSPHARTRVSVRDSAGRGAGALTLRRNEPANWSIRLPKGRNRILFSRCFVPADVDGGADERELAARLLRCEVRHPDGRSELLWGVARA